MSGAGAAEATADGPADDPADGPADDLGDPGLAGERTELAWSRSGLAAVAAVAVLVRHLWPLRGGRVDLVLALVATGSVLWVAAALSARRRSGRRSAGRVGTFRLVTVATVLLAVAGAVLALTVGD